MVLVDTSVGVDQRRSRPSGITEAVVDPTLWHPVLLEMLA